MTKTRFSRTLLQAALVGALLVPASVQAYVIILKDGSPLIAKEKPTLQGKNYIYQTKLGANQSIPVSEVDEAKTEAANKAGVGDAQVLGGGGSQEITAPRSKEPTLSQHIQGLRNEGRLKAPEPTPAAHTDGGTQVASRSTTKEKPEEKAPAQIDPMTNDTFQRALDAGSVHGARLALMSANGLKITAVTENEQAVFAALGACARGLKEVRANGKPLEKLDISLATSGNEVAGRFLMTPEDAENLLAGKTSVQKYFLAAVIF